MDVDSSWAAVSSGTWLSTGKTIALSSADPCDYTPSVSLTATVGKGPTLGSSTTPGYVDAPGLTDGSWYAAKAP